MAKNSATGWSACLNSLISISTLSVFCFVCLFLKKIFFCASIYTAEQKFGALNLEKESNTILLLYSCK
jgi:hypothetical protein